MANESNNSTIRAFEKCGTELATCEDEVSSLCCFIAIIVQFLHYHRSAKTAIFFHEFNGEELITAFKMLSKFYIQPKVFSLSHIPPDSIVKTLPEFNWFFVWCGRHPKDQIQSNRLLREMSAKGLMEKPRVWMVLINGGNGPDSSPSLLRDVELSPASYVGIVTSSNEVAKQFELHDVYRNNNDDSLTTTLVGIFSPNNNYDRLGIFPHTLRPLKNYTVRVSTLRRPPFVDYDDEENKLTGYLGYIMNSIQNVINLRYDINVVDDNQTIFAELDEDKADVILGVHTMNRGRARLYDYSPSVISGTILLTFRRLDAIVESTAYTKPFTTNAWIVIFTICLTATAELWLTFRLSPLSPSRNALIRSKYGYRSRDDVYTLKTSALMSFGALLQRGAANLPEMRSSQAVWLVYFIFCYIVYAMGTSKFTSFLTVVKQPLPFTSLDDLIDRTQYKLIVVNKSSRYDLYHNSSDARNMEISKRIDHYVINSQKGVEDSYYTNMAFIDHNIQCLPFVFGNCDFQTVPVGDHYKPGFYLIFKKNFALTQIYSIAIGRLSESGILERLRRGKFFDHENFCRTSSGTNAITISQVFYLLAFLGLGIALAIIAGFIEFCLNRSNPVNYSVRESNFVNSAKTRQIRDQTPRAKRKLTRFRRLLQSRRLKIYISNNRR